MRIELTAKHQALAKGTNAGARALDEVNAAGKGDYESRLAFFWLAVGMAAAQERDVNLADAGLQELYVRGAASNAPARRRQLPEARIVNSDLLCGHQGCNAAIETLREGGYTQSWSFSYDGTTKKATATSNGLSDYDGNGDGDYVLACGKYHDSAVPFDDWKWS